MHVAKDFSRGFGCFTKGLKTWASKPRLMLLGALPAIIVSLLMFLLVVWTISNTYEWATALTGFADGWGPLLREGLRISMGLAFAAAIIVFCIVTFVTITLTVGAPFYERIWKDTEASLGGLTHQVQFSLRQQVSKSTGDILRTLQIALTTSVIAFLIGLIPVVGSIAAAIFVTVRGSRALAVELTAYAADARGWSFAERKQRLDARPLLMFGASFPCYLACLVPGGAVVMMPAAVVAGTHLVRELESTNTYPRRPVA